MTMVIEVENLHKAYDEFEAVRGIDLCVHRGEVFAFLGPNGAGKTTTVEILEGYRDRDEGEVSVLGLDPANATRAWRERIGIVLQECRMEPVLTVRETLSLYAGYYSSPRDVAETIGLVGLSSSSDVRAGNLSGGQQRRLDVALALIGDPELLFLDEPTTGFDPSARRQAWDVIASLRDLGKTVLLTTHYMDEAQFLADRVAIIRDGRIVAEGVPDELGGRADAETTIRFAAPQGLDPGEVPAGAGRLTVGTANGGDATIEIATGEPVATLNALTGWALEHGVDLQGLEVRRPSLEDVYLELTEEHPG
jgi:ABC-2 type transport system ATP-binding protein